MIIHISSQYLHVVTAGSYEWAAFRSYYLATNWAVPVFCMISGSLFLSKDIPLKTIITRNIAKIAGAFVIWSAIYAVVFERQNGLGSMAASFVRGYSHLWFLYMIAGLYLLTPILRRIASDEKLLLLYVFLGAVFVILIPEMLVAISLVSEKVGTYLGSAYSSVDFHVVSGYALYYMLGYYLDKLEIDRKWIKWIALLGIGSYLVTAFWNYSYGCAMGDEFGYLFGNFTIGDFIRSSCIFVICKSYVNKEKTSNLAAKLGVYSFTAYLVHQIVITLLNRLGGLNTLSFNAALSVPAIGIITLVISYVVAFVLAEVKLLFNKAQISTK